jgi:hypothetical protein
VNRRFAIVLVIVLCFGVGVLGYVFRLRLATSAELERQTKLGAEEGVWIHEHVTVPTEKRILARENFTSALEKFGLSHQEATNASSAAQQAFNLRQVRAGNTITVGRSTGVLREIDYKMIHRMLKIVPAAEGFTAEVQRPIRWKSQKLPRAAGGFTLQCREQAGESPEIAMRLAQIFGYDLTSTDPRKGDTFRVT